MRSLKFTLSNKENVSAWEAAVHLLAGYLQETAKANQLLERLPSSFAGERRAACQSLFMGSLRHGHRVRCALHPFLRKTPRPLVEAVLLVAGFELLDADVEKHPKIVHHAVEQSKSLVPVPERGLINAVLRQLPDALAAMDPLRDPAGFFSHPDWLVQRWFRQIGEVSARQLLAWNQNRPETYLKVYNPNEASLPKTLEPTRWPLFYKLAEGASWQTDLLPLLNRGTTYLKDPSTRLAPALLAPQAGETILDLCSAPGGKAFDLAHAMGRKGQLVAVDLPGTRIERLRQNLDQLKSPELQCSILEVDVLNLQTSHFEKMGLPTRYDAVMLDAPCSNTGVIQRRTDVKWRLRPGDFKNCTRLQIALLRSAAAAVRPGGRIVYSTCSIETSENRAVVDTFLQSSEGRVFKLKDFVSSYPWQSGHDGAGAFLLVNTSA